MFTSLFMLKKNNIYFMYCKLIHNNTKDKNNFFIDTVLKEYEKINGGHFIFLQKLKQHMKNNTS